VIVEVWKHTKAMNFYYTHPKGPPIHDLQAKVEFLVWYYVNTFPSLTFLVPPFTIGGMKEISRLILLFFAEPGGL